MVDIKQSKKSKTNTKDTTTNNKITKSDKKEDTFKAGAVQYADGELMIPPRIQSMLNSIGAQYGVPFDLANISIGDGTMAEKTKALRTIVDMMTNDSKLLPEMFKLIKKLLNKDIKLAKFHAKLVKAATDHQIKLDKSVADIALTMAGFQATSEKRQLKTNKRIEIIETRAEKYKDYYSGSVFGDEMALIDIEIQTKTVNQKALSASKQERIKFDADRKEKSIAYINSAFEG